MLTNTHDGEETSCCKIGRVGGRYGLDNLDDQLARRWTADGPESASLRDLEAYVNRRVLEAALADADNPPIDGEVENLRRLLTDDDVTENRRLEATRRLERQGIDVDRVLRDFVSHQTVHNHLRNCLEVSPDTERTDEERFERARSTVFALQNRTEAVTDRTVEQLKRNDVLDVEGYDVLVNIQVICDECGRATDLGTFLDDQGCVCQT